MAGTKISALTDGGTLQAADQVPVARGSANNKLTGDDFVCVLARQAGVSTVNSTAVTTIATGTVPANQLGTNRTVEWRLGGYSINNLNSTDLTHIQVSLGGTVLFDDITAHLLSANKVPWILNVSIQAAGAADAQRCYGLFMEGSITAPAVGIGDLNTDEIRSAAPFGNISSTLDTTLDQTFLVTMTNTVADSSFGMVSYGGPLLRY